MAKLKHNLGQCFQVQNNNTIKSKRKNKDSKLTIQRRRNTLPRSRGLLSVAEHLTVKIEVSGATDRGRSLLRGYHPHIQN
jgi:hypothetical protein